MREKVDFNRKSKGFLPDKQYFLFKNKYILNSEDRMNNNANLINELFSKSEGNPQGEDGLLLFDNSIINSEYDEPTEKHSYPTSDIHIEKATFSVYELKRKIGPNGKSILNSSFQRNEVWKEKQQIELIESVLMGLPLPLFYFSKNAEGRLIVVDGRQRLTAFFKFMNDGFALKNLKNLPSRYEHKFSELDPLTQSKIEDYQLQAYLILPPTPDQVQYDIFERVNRAGTPLNKQEIRNAINQGKSTELLNKVVKSSPFKDITADAFAKDKRMKAQYLVLRLISFYLWRMELFPNNWPLQTRILYEFKNSDDMFSFYMRCINRFSPNDEAKLTEKLNLGFANFLNYCTPDDLRIKSNGKKTPINMNIFEVILYIMIRIPCNLASKIVHKKIELLMDNTLFLKNLIKHRDSEQDIVERFEIAEQIIKELC